MMVIIFIKTTITYFSLKSKIYQKKVPVMTNRTLKRTSVFVNINPIMTVCYVIYGFQMALGKKQIL